MGVTVKKCHRIMSAGMTAGTERVSVAAKRYRVNSTDAVSYTHLTLPTNREV